ncbi:MAG TPA: CocE/NonD family hydrolase, partial [Verrucomicrobiae bacterium]|nr:CocE/NonD family hydrolase [Verrucomicrobiae bacterium]
MKTAVCAALLVLVAVSVGGAPKHGAAAEQTTFNVRSNYTKQEFHVRMRDGVTLFTEVFSPKDMRKTYPILLLRTPYSVSPYGAKEFPKSLGPADALAQDGFIYVNQDVRGRYLSEGEFIDVQPHKEHLNGATDTDPSTDTYDTVDWLVRNVPNNNGRVGTWGVSYPGFYSAFSLIDSHPALKAASPQAPMADVGNGDDAYHNGAFYLSANFGFYTGFWPRGPKPDRESRRKDFDFGTEDQYDFYLRMGPLANAEDLCFKHENEYWSDMLEHPNYDDFWASRALSPDMRGLMAPVLVVGGWFDAEDLGGTLKLFHAIDSGSGAPGVTLVMGPWSHGQWTRQSGESLGNLKFGSKTA